MDVSVGDGGSVILQCCDIWEGGLMDGERSGGLPDRFATKRGSREILDRFLRLDDVLTAVSSLEIA